MKPGLLIRNIRLGQGGPWCLLWLVNLCLRFIQLQEGQEHNNHGGATKDENISFGKNISNSILRIYREMLIDILTQNISEVKIDRNLWRCWKKTLKNDLRSNNSHFEVVLLKKLIYV